MTGRWLALAFGFATLLVAANMLHIISIAYLAGLISGIALAVLVLHKRSNVNR